MSQLHTKKQRDNVIYKSNSVERKTDVILTPLKIIYYNNSINNRIVKYHNFT